MRKEDTQASERAQRLDEQTPRAASRATASRSCGVRSTVARFAPSRRATLDDESCSVRIVTRYGHTACAPPATPQLRDVLRVSAALNPLRAWTASVERVLMARSVAQRTHASAALATPERHDVLSTQLRCRCTQTGTAARLQPAAARCHAATSSSCEFEHLLREEGTAPVARSASRDAVTQRLDDSTVRAWTSSMSSCTITMTVALAELSDGTCKCQCHVYPADQLRSVRLGRRIDAIICHLRRLSRRECRRRRRQRARPCSRDVLHVSLAVELRVGWSCRRVP